MGNKHFEKGGEPEEEICAKCGKTEEKHCEQWFENGKWYSCKKFISQEETTQEEVIKEDLKKELYN